LDDLISTSFGETNIMESVRTDDFRAGEKQGIAVNKHFIGGDWVASQSGATLPLLNPGTGQPFVEIADGAAIDIDIAVAAARHAFEEGVWGRLAAVERGRLLLRLADKISDNADELSRLEGQDTGKPITQARTDVSAAARYFEFYGSAADKLMGETIPYTQGHFVAVLREPRGVTGHILPWNYPAQMFGRTLAPSLAVGNTTVLKPAEEACASILKLAALASEAGFPPGAINIVTGRGEIAGAALAAHPDIDFVSFTGSPEVGRIVQRAAADHYAACTLELGGKSPQIIFADADIDAALPVVIKAIVQNSGQTCSAGSRVLIEKKIYDHFVYRLADAFRSVQVGTSEMDLDCGPLISANQQRRVEGFLETAQRDGIPELATGQLATGLPSSGFYVRPVLFGPVPRTHTLAREEVFGPVLSALPFEDEDDAVRLANSTEYGLTAAIWTVDGSRQLRVARRLRCGQVFVNTYGAGAGIELPFGGVKKSGHGREKGLVALEEFSTAKTIVIRHG
jgi:aldehyde dehydrogenase (NAD+)